MSRLPVPIRDVDRRLPEAGRIRFGVKTAKAMKTIDHFRFTSHDRSALQQVADKYGGEVVPWSDPKAAPGQFEVITQASEIDVVLPPDPLGGTPVYELWGGGGCERRCDGETCTVIQNGADGLEPVEIDCKCMAAGRLACSPKTRLSVVLAGVRFGGTWRLETGSENAMREIPGMVEMILGLQQKGLVCATLALKPRRNMINGTAHHFIVPTLAVRESLEQIAAGAARLGALPPADVDGPAAIGAGSGSELPTSEPEPVSPTGSPAPPEPSPGNHDDDVVDAELVEDEPPEPDPPPSPAPGGQQPATEQQVKAINHQLRFKRGILGPDRWPFLSEMLGRKITSMALSFDEAAMLIDRLNTEEAKA